VVCGLSVRTGLSIESERCGHKLLMSDTCAVLILNFTTILLWRLWYATTFDLFVSFVVWPKTSVQETQPPVPEGKRIKIIIQVAPNPKPWHSLKHLQTGVILMIYPQTPVWSCINISSGRKLA